MVSKAAIDASSAAVAASSAALVRGVAIGVAVGVAVGGGAGRRGAADAGAATDGRDAGAGGGDIDTGGVTGFCVPSAATAPRTCVMRRPTADVAAGVGAVAAGEMVAAKLEIASSADAFRSPVFSR